MVGLPDRNVHVLHPYHQHRQHFSLQHMPKRPLISLLPIWPYLLLHNPTLTLGYLYQPYIYIYIYACVCVCVCVCMCMYAKLS